MNTYKIAVVVGSLRKDSFNEQLAKALVKLAPPEFTFKFLDIGTLPLYNQDDDGNQAASVKQFKKDIESSQGLIFVTPEYNRSIPGVLKNALDNASRPWGQNSWAGKPCAIIGITIGTLGTALAQQHLRNILAALDAPTLCQPEAFLQVKDGFFTPNGDIGDGSKAYLQGWMAKYVNWVKKLV